MVVPVLMVEDSALDAEIAFLNFRRGGLVNSIHHVKNGEEALNYFFHQGRYEDSSRFPVPGLVLLDINLPRVSGWEVLEAVSEAQGLADIPILVMTSTERDEELVDKLDRKNVGRITKPGDVAPVTVPCN